MFMKKKAVIIISAAVAAAVLLIVLVLGIFLKKDGAVWQNEFEKRLLGNWAYNHDLGTKVASFQKNGKAGFEGKKYDFTCDGSYIYFTDHAGEVMKLRYVQEKEDVVDIYIKSTYVLEDGTAPTGVEGVWICPEKKWTFEFTAKGTFLEDGVLTGYYFVDESAGTIRLAYEKVLSDTVFYYTLTSEGMIVEYPWTMKKMK